MRRERAAPNQGELFPAAVELAPDVPRGPGGPGGPDVPDLNGPPQAFADAKDRELAVTSFDRPILLEAGAGTGKTGTLTARILTWILGPGWEEAERRFRALSGDDLAHEVLRGVVAITFTEAAAAEMSARVARALAEVERASSGATLDLALLPRSLVPSALAPDARTIHARARALRGALSALSTSTIHAFCRRLLAAHPMEAGLDPNFQVDASGSLAVRTVHAVLEDELRSGFSALAERDLVALARRGIGPTELERDLVLLLDAGARAVDFAGEALDEATSAELFLRVAEPLRELSALLPRLSKVAHNTPYALAALEGTARLLAPLPDGPAPPSRREQLTAVCAGLGALWDKRARDRLKKWSKGEEESLIAAERRALGAEAPQFLARAAELWAALEPLSELDPEGLEAARRTVHALLSRVEAHLRASGVATFGDLLFEARALLRDRPDVARAERARMRQLLVDEFQDTDALQCDLVRVLAIEGPADERPCLFVVGDAKQSIFSWRNADLAAFDAFAEDLVRAGGVRLALTRNFRSRPAILAEVERALTPVMERVHGVQPAFVGLEPDREPPGELGELGERGGARHAPAVEYWVSWTRGEAGELEARTRGKKLESYRSEARALASDLLRRHGEDGLLWQDVAILFRSLTDVEPYLRELRERDVPYEVQSDRKYYQRREVIDAGALVRAVLDPNDHLALLALLRSPLVGLPDAAVFPLWARGFPGRMSSLRGTNPAAEDELARTFAEVARALPDDIPGLAEIAGWEESAAHAVRSIARLRASFRVLAADAWIAELCGLFLPEPLEAARFLGAWRLSNLQRFFRDLLRALEEREGDVQSVLSMLRANLARDDKSESARPADSGRDAVKILTIHGAKGLEFRHVYCPQLHKEDSKSDTFGFDRRAGRIAYRVFDLPNPAWFATRRERQETEAAERVRLAYVALTRARDRLVLAGAFPFERRARPWRQCANAIELFEHHPSVETALAELARRARADERAPFVDEAGAHWLTTLWMEGELARRAAETAMPRTPLAEAEEDSARLAAARAGARARRRRPFQARPSEEAGHADFEARAARGFDEARGSETAGLGRRGARAAGTAVHRALETLDLADDPARALANAARALPELVRAALEDEVYAPALERAQELWERFRSGPLAARLFALEDHVLARELAIVLPPGPEADAPVGFVAGAIDLLYRDPSQHTPGDPKGADLVVVDFKTDRVEDERELAERAAAYRAQGTIYVRAVRESLGLERDPRLELWFLHAGAVVGG